MASRRRHPKQKSVEAACSNYLQLQRAEVGVESAEQEIWSGGEFEEGGVER